jgi:anti-sigma regulatory factor (Ser/Thr protein kinase)
MGMLRVSLANDVSEVRRIYGALHDFLSEEGVPERGIHHVRLVIEELVVNIVRYGYDDHNAHRIDLDVRTEPRRVAVTIEDDGRPFDPIEAPPPAPYEQRSGRQTGGLGIFLVKQLTSELTYSRQNDHNRIRATIDYAPR